ncbi:hypothetical protein ACWD4B_06075 [Streptomyces sp. NPDC002536]
MSRLTALHAERLALRQDHSRLDICDPASRDQMLRPVPHLTQHPANAPVVNRVQIVLQHRLGRAGERLSGNRRV